VGAGGAGETHVVADRDRRLAELGRARNQLLRLADAPKKGECGAGMEFNVTHGWTQMNMDGKMFK
jgi:hypothetical protein